MARRHEKAMISDMNILWPEENLDVFCNLWMIFINIDENRLEQALGKNKTWYNFEFWPLFFSMILQSLLGGDTLRKLLVTSSPGG